MYLKTEGLILRETDYKDTDKLLTVLTKDRGQLTLRARGCRSKGSKIKSGCQLMAFSEFTVFENRGYMVVDEAVPIELFMPLRNDIEALALASYFTQAAEILSQEDEPNPELLSLTLNSLFALSKGRKSHRLIKGAFELRAACLAGYEPMLHGCSICGASEPQRFLVSEGVLQCVECVDHLSDGIRMPVHPGVLAAMRYIVTCNPKKLFSFQISSESEKELSEISETYFLTQLERGFFTLDFYKSLQIL